MPDEATSTRKASVAAVELRDITRTPRLNLTLTPVRLEQQTQSKRACDHIPDSASASRAQLHRFKTGRNAEADLALDAQRLQRDRILRTADQPVRADADTRCRAALRASIAAGNVAGAKPADWSKDAPCQCRLLGDTEIDTDLLDARDIEIIGTAIGPQHAAQIGDRADDEADAGAAATFKHTDLNTLRLLGAGERSDQNRGGRGDQR